MDVIIHNSIYRVHSECRRWPRPPTNQTCGWVIIVIPAGTCTDGGKEAPGGKTIPSLKGQQLSGKPFLYRTPHALHRVLGPKGPHLHCGVCDEPQFKHMVIFLEEDLLWVPAWERWRTADIVRPEYSMYSLIWFDPQCNSHNKIN